MCRIGKDSDLRVENITQVWITCQRRSKLKHLSTPEQNSITDADRKAPARTFLRPWVIARVDIERAPRASDSKARTVACDARCSEGFPDLPSFRLLAFRISGTAEGAVEAQGRRGIGGPIVRCRLCWSLDRGAQTDSNRSLVRPAQRVGAGEALRPSP